jgi:hypothetical protein
MFDDDEDGKWIPSDNEYYGGSFNIAYKGEKTTFNWMYIDYNTLQNAAFANGLQAELILEGNIMIFLRSCQFRNKEKTSNSSILRRKKPNNNCCLALLI